MQENRLAVANLDLEKAQAELDAKQAELNVVRAEYEEAMTEKLVSNCPHFGKSSSEFINQIHEYLHT